MMMKINFHCRTGSTASAGHKPKRRAYLLRKRAFSTGTFFDASKKDSSDKGKKRKISLLLLLPPGTAAAGQGVNSRSNIYTIVIKCFC